MFIQFSMNTKIKTSFRAKNLLQTTIVLTATTLFARTIAVYYNVYLSGKIGAVGIGTFELIMSIYVFAKTASSAGVSLAATRMSAEQEHNLSQTMRRILFTCFLLGGGCGIVLSLLAPFLCKVVLSNPPGGCTSLRILALSLPFLSMSSACVGYFVAKRKMRLYAPVQICEQLIRVWLTIVLLEKFTNDSLSFSICSIALAITLSEVVAFLFSVLFYLFIKQKKEREMNVPLRSFARSFTRLALPVGSGALFRASLNTVYNILVPHGLKKSGTTSDRALASYGLIQGMALPIILYPSALMGAVSLQLVPEIAGLNAQKKKKQILYITKRVLRASLLFSILCAGILFFFASELSVLLFKTTESAFYIQALAPLIPVMYLDMVTDGILKGLDLQLKVLTIGICDSLLSLALIYFLLPPFAMTGYLVTIYAGECLNTFLGQRELRRHLKIRFSLWRDIILPIFCISAGAWTIKRITVFHPLFNGFSLVFGILASLALCFIFLLLTQTISQEELLWARGLVASFFRKGEKVKRGEEKSKKDTQARIPSAQSEKRIAGNRSRSEMYAINTPTQAQTSARTNIYEAR